jgi:hypothetical protein
MISDAYILGLVANATPCFGYFKGGDVCDGCALTTQCKASLEDRTGRMVLAVQAKRALEAQKQEAQKQEAQKQEAQKQEAQKQEAQKQEAQKQEAQKQPGARARKMVAPVVPVASGSPDESIDDILATIDVSSPTAPSAKMAPADFDDPLGTTSSQDSDLSDFFNALSSVPAPVAPVAPLTTQTTVSTFTMVKVVSDTPCCKCGKDISKNTQAAFFTGSGLAHSNCVLPGEV